jgi:site-specific DNA-methyltransferase (adenine-specific)
MNIIYNEDCLETMKGMENNSIDLTITSPPYDSLRIYNGYSFNFPQVAKSLYEVTKPGGVLVWIVGDETIKGSETGTSFRQALGLKEAGFNLHDTMIWRKTNPMPKFKHKRYFDVFEYMFILSKGQPKTFNPLLQPNKRAGELYDYTAKLKTTGKVRTKKTFNINDERYKDNIWECAVAKNETDHPAVFPESLIADHITSWSNEGDIVYDPFIGSGTTALVARSLGRNYIGSEISQEYCQIAEKRLA